MTSIRVVLTVVVLATSVACDYDELIGREAGSRWQLLLADEELSSNLVVDGDALYWVSKGDRTLRRLPKRGGDVTTLASLDPENCCHTLLLADEHVYYAEHEALTDETGYILGHVTRIRRVPKGGGAVATVVTTPDFGQPFAVEADRLHYVAASQVRGARRRFAWHDLRTGEIGGIEASSTGGVRVSLVGAAVLAANEDREAALHPLDGSRIPWSIVEGSSIRDLLPDDRHVYWSTSEVLRRAPLDDAAIETMVTLDGEVLLGELSQDAANVYAALGRPAAEFPPTNAILAVSKADGGSTRISATFLPERLAADGTGIYAAAFVRAGDDFPDGGIYVLPPPGDESCGPQ